MTDPRTDDHHTPSQRRAEEANLLDDATSLMLSRTKSHEIPIGDGLVQQTTPAIIDPRDHRDGTEPAVIWPNSVRYWVYLCAFITSLAFGTTQVPMLYAFRLMTCYAYYENHPSSTFDVSLSSTSPVSTKSILSYWLATSSRSNVVDSLNKDRCSVPEIEASTALAFAICGAGTTIFGIVNLFITGSLIKRMGVKSTLFLNTFFPAVRLLIQNVGMEVWGFPGIMIIQCSQMVSVVGGPSGYMLALNTYITEVVEYEGRTGALGRLQGGMLFGSASGFLIGGLIAEPFGIKAPFRLTLLLFCLASLYVLAALPYIKPAQVIDLKKNISSSSKKRKSAVDKYLGPLAVFVPQKFVRKDGVVQREYGTFLLAWSVFLGILASGYLQTMLQMYATDIFGFATTENGWLIFMYSTLRGTFLTFAFPKLIAAGRRLSTRKEEAARKATTENATAPIDSEREPLLANANGTPTFTAPLKPGAVVSTPSNPSLKDQRFTFDLVYTRFSLIADGTLTLLCTFISQGWQMYLMAAILPFAAGTGSAAKGTILQMVGSSASSSERSDALTGVSLVENIARLSTTFVFGVVFAAFAKMGRQELVFTCNAAAALLGFIVMLFARFPPEGSRKLEDDEEVDVRDGEMET